jgi:hypothetical protein
MKVAIVWNYPSRLLDCSFRFEQYLAGLRTLGHEPVVVCTESSAEGGGFDAPVVTAASPAAFEDADFWRRVGAEAAIVVTWLRMPEVLRAIRDAGTRVVAISDSDGLMGMIAFPRAGFERLMVYRDGVADTLKRLKYFAARQLLDRRRGTAEDRTAIESVRASDVVTICHQVGIERFRRFLARYGAEDLAGRLRRVPFTIGASFLACPLPDAKDDRVVTVGRWDDPQKNTPLLARAVDGFLEQRPQTEVVVFGAGGERWLKPLEKRHASFSYRGVQHQEIVARTARWSSPRPWRSGRRSSGCRSRATRAMPAAGRERPERSVPSRGAGVRPTWREPSPRRWNVGTAANVTGTALPGIGVRSCSPKSCVVGCWSSLERSGRRKPASPQPGTATWVAAKPVFGRT